MNFNISFEIDGMPPRKDGGHSMWNMDKEVKKLLALRTKTQVALQGLKKPLPIMDYLRLTIDIHLSEKELERSDIDNLVGGVFDGLQNASKNTILNEEYKQYEGTPIHPSNAILFNDSRVLEMNVKKTINEQRNYYQISIESINLNEIRLKNLI
jgi:hypothetical protein